MHYPILAATSDRAPRQHRKCADCAHSKARRSLFITTTYCGAPEVTDTVTGDAVLDARSMRTQFAICGPDGALFSERPAQRTPQAQEPKLLTRARIIELFDMRAGLNR